MARSRPGSATDLPVSVKAAAALFAVSGLATLLNATVMSGAGGWLTGRELPWVALRLAAVALVVWGLLGRAWWSWGLGVALAAIWVAWGALSILVTERGDIYWPSPSAMQGVLVASLLALGLALALLLSPAARRAFRRTPD
jgi:hypothetical protein